MTVIETKERSSANLFKQNFIISGSLESQKQKSFKISYKEGFNIFIHPQTLPSRLGDYFHELGHDIGEQLSFKNSEVLTPDEVNKTKIDLSFKENLYIIHGIIFPSLGYINHLERNIADRIIHTLTKGNFNPKDYVIHNTSHEKIIEYLKNFPKTYAYRTTQSGFEAISTKEGRNEEIAAYTTSYGAMIILGNSIKLPLFKAKYLPSETIASHKRALNIVIRAYESKGWILPSTFDIYEDEYLDSKDK